MTKAAACARLVVGAVVAGGLSVGAVAQEPARLELPGVAGNETRGDVNEWLVTGGMRYQRGGLEIRANNAVVVLDQQEYRGQVLSAGQRSGLPRRGTLPPDARRALSEDVLRQRLAAFLRAAGSGETSIPKRGIGYLDVIRSLYLEGDVVVVQDGLEVIRAARAFLSTVDDRAVFYDVTLRLSSSDGRGGQRIVVVRGAKILRQGTRITGRNLSVTTCAAGEPHFEVFSGEVEVIERGDEFEILSRDNRIAFSGVSVVPIPDLGFYTSDQNQFPIKSVSAGYSSQEKARAQIVFGSSFNEVGGSVHEFLTGRPASEFKGDWRAGVGYIQTRGAPLDGELEYEADGVYAGRTFGYYLDDKGTNIREIRTNFDGSPITETNRVLGATENRVQLGDDTRLDLTAFYAGDPAVYSEFFPRYYYDAKLPETSVYLRHAHDNYIATAVGRWNLDSFSYQDNRALAPFFVEKLPSATFDLFSQPLLQLPGETPLLLTSSTGVAQFSKNYDNTVTGLPDDNTVRLNQELGLTAPFLIGPFGLEPFVRGGITYYDKTPTGEDRTRTVLSAGATLGTRLSRTWSWAGDDPGETRGIRHSLYPTVAFISQSTFNGEPTDFFQYDGIDRTDDGTVIRVGLLQTLQESTRSADDALFGDSVWLDLAQNFTPISGRDNNGHELGLFEFELLVSPRAAWLPLTGWLVHVEGEQDWNKGELRTFNTYAQLPAAGITWFGAYRTDETSKGQITYGAAAPFRGRWALAGQAQYDLETRQNLDYNVSLTRADHDWRITIGLRFDAVSDDTSLNFDFEPSFGGLLAPVQRRYLGAPLYGGGAGPYFN